MPSQVMLQMFGTGDGGTDDAVAQIDIPDDGVIEGVDWAVAGGLDAAGETLYTELSFIATNQLTTNDARGVLSTCRARFEVVTSGGAIAAINRYVPMDVDVSGGERIYIHVVAAASLASTITAVIHFRPTRGLPRRSRRRR